MTDSAPEAKSLEERVREVIESIRPLLQADGGDIEFVGLEDEVVQVRLKGACTGCPHAGVTLQMGVERRLRELIPEIKGVVNAS